MTQPPPWRLRGRRWSARKVDDSLAEHVFHRDGRRITSYWWYWHQAVVAVGMPDKLFHDLRRITVRNWVRAGAPETTARMWSGHTTRGVFDRYNIVNDADMREALSKGQTYLDAAAAAGAGLGRS